MTFLCYSVDISAVKKGSETSPDLSTELEKPGLCNVQVSIDLTPSSTVQPERTSQLFVHGKK